MFLLSLFLCTIDAKHDAFLERGILATTSDIIALVPTRGRLAPKERARTEIDQLEKALTSKEAWTDLDIVMPSFGRVVASLGNAYRIVTNEESGKSQTICAVVNGVNHSKQEDQFIEFLRLLCGTLLQKKEVFLEAETVVFFPSTQKKIIDTSPSAIKAPPPSSLSVGRDEPASRAASPSPANPAQPSGGVAVLEPSTSVALTSVAASPSVTAAASSAVRRRSTTVATVSSSMPNTSSMLAKDTSINKYCILVSTPSAIKYMIDQAESAEELKKIADKHPDVRNLERVYKARMAFLEAFKALSKAVDLAALKTFKTRYRKSGLYPEEDGSINPSDRSRNPLVQAKRIREAELKATK